MINRFSLKVAYILYWTEIIKIIWHVFQLQSADGEKGGISGRTKNAEQLSVQHVKTHRNPEETRKQRVNIWMYWLHSCLMLLYWHFTEVNHSFHLYRSQLASAPSGTTENLSRAGADEEEEFTKLSKWHITTTKRVWTEGKYQTVQCK